MSGVGGDGVASALRRGFKAEAERIALEARAELGLDPSNRLDCRDLAAHLGIPIVQVRDLEGEGAAKDSIRQLVQAEAGFSALTVCAGSARLVVYNQRQPPGRRANSLAHELAHVILEHPPAPALDGDRHRSWDAEREAEADWLAGALLVPREGALAWLRRERSLDGGERHFGVSRALFVWRAYQTGVARQFASRSPALFRPRRGLAMLRLEAGSGDQLGDD
jgi:hypothetical protein